MRKSFSCLRAPLNRLLLPLNLRLDTHTAERRERSRLEGLKASGYFDALQFPVPEGFTVDLFAGFDEELNSHRQRLDSFKDERTNSVGFSYANSFFRSPDAEVYYCMLMRYRPCHILEIGCGNSTKIARQAILDSGAKSKLSCIDPSPRADIAGLADEIRLTRVEDLDAKELAKTILPGDCLFIDSSHESRIGADIPFLYLHLLPNLLPGVLIHIHDIFLPYDYPWRFAIGDGRNWNEQYLVQLMLTTSREFEVLWPGYFLQRSVPNFKQSFPHMNGNDAQSLWLRSVGQN